MASGAILSARATLDSKQFDT
jgi:hypothetical protein